MKLYHGSLQIIKEPRILIPNRTLDYGSGFYTTTSEQQAKDWVYRKLSENGIGYINEYEFDESQATSLELLKFDNTPNEEWIDFVYANRTTRGFTHNHDLVYGPVANDRVYAAFSLYEQGLLGKHELITELRTYKLVDQMLFHTERSLECLTFVKAEEVHL